MAANGTGRGSALRRVSSGRLACSTDWRIVFGTLRGYGRGAVPPAGEADGGARPSGQPTLPAPIACAHGCYLHHRHRRQPLQAPGLRLPERRDLRRHPVGVGLRPARRRAQGEHQAAVVAGPWSTQPRRRRRPRLLGDPARAQVWEASGHVGDVHRPARRVPELPQALPRRPPAGGVRRARRASPTPTTRLADVACPNCGTRGAVDRAARLQRHAQDLPRPRSRTSRACTTCAPRPRRASSSTSPTSLNASRKKPPFGIGQIGKTLPQRDHARQLHLPHPRVRADGDGVLRRARQRRGVAPVLDRRAHRLVHRPRHRAREPAPLRAPEGEALALLEAHRRHRVPLRLPRLASGASSRASPTAPTSTSRRTPSTPASTCRYFDQATGERYTPYVIEPAAGLTRSLMAFLVDAYAEDEAPNAKGGVDKRVVLRLDPRLAPVKVAVLPLSRNADLSPEGPDLAAAAAPELERRLRRRRRHRPPLPPPGRDRHAVLRHRRLRHARRPGRDGARARLDEPGAGRPRPGRGLPRRAPARLLTDVTGAP